MLNFIILQFKKVNFEKGFNSFSFAVCLVTLIIIFLLYLKAFYQIIILKTN
jgi:hypothetical protein